MAHDMNANDKVYIIEADDGTMIDDNAFMTSKEARNWRKQMGQETDKIRLVTVLDAIANGYTILN